MNFTASPNRGVVLGLQQQLPWGQPQAAGGMGFTLNGLCLMEGARKKIGSRKRKINPEAGLKSRFARSNANEVWADTSI